MQVRRMAASLLCVILVSLQQSTAAERGAATPTPRQLIVEALAAGDRGDPLPSPLVNEAALEDDFWMHWWTCTIGWEAHRGPVCPVGDVKARRTIVVYGDSHAGMWLPELHGMGLRKGFRVVPLIKLGCSPFDVTQRHNGRPYPSCPEFRDWAVGRIDSINPVMVVLGYRGLWAVKPDAGETAAEAWRTGTRSAVRRLARLTHRVLVLGDVSAKGFWPAGCLNAPHADMGSCTTDVEGVVQTANRVTSHATLAAGGEFVVTQNLVCAEGRCPLVVARIITFHDPSHLTMTWTHRVSDVLRSRIWPAAS
jgi:hypothetical protein